MDASPLPGHPEPLFGDDMLPLPEMMFAAGEEPVGVRVLTYQSSRSINHILESLEDDEIQTLRMSPFWKIVEISEKPSFSGRFARFMLSRQLKVEKKHEAWFRFAGKPIRFSIREFAIVTGLNCGKYPKNCKRNAKVKRKAKPYWPELFGRSDELRVTTALKNLRRKTITDKEVRIKLACLAIVFSVILATNLKMKMIKEHADAMVDLEEFFSFPWGRLAFEMLMGSIKQRNEVSLSTDTIAVKGFALALQLVMVEAVPALTEVVLESYSSSDSDSSDDGDDFFQKNNRQKTLSLGHARDLDKTKDVVVRSIIPDDPDRPIIAESLQWEDEVMDVKVDNLLKLIAEGQRGGKRKRKSIPVKEKETDEEKRIASIVSSMLQSEFERVDASVANAVSLSDKTAKEVEALERRIMVSIQNELQNFKEEVIRSVMEVHNKANGRTVTTGPNVNSSNNEVREGDNAVPQRDPYAADRGVDARTSTAANPASPIPYVVQPNVPSSHDPPLSATSENNGSTKIASGGVQIGNTVHQPISRDMSEGSNHDMPTRSYNSHAINPPAAVVASSSARLREEQNPLPYATGFVQSMDTRAEHGEEDSNEEALLPPSSPKTKRHKTLPSDAVMTLPSDAVIETNPRRENLTVNQPAANPFNAYSDIDVVMSKYTKLCQKLSQSFVINVAGLAVTSTYLTAIAELKHSLPARVIDILVRFVRTTYKREVNSRSERNPLFLDTRYVALMCKHYEKFEPSKSPDSYNFPKDLLQFLCSDDTTTPPFTHYYFPFDLGNKQWIGVCFDCAAWKITVLDCNLTVVSDSEMAIKLQPFTQMIPALLNRNGREPTIACEFGAVFERPTGIHQNRIHAHSGVTAILMMQSHAMFGIDGCRSITPTHVKAEAKRIVVMLYELHQKL
uniref:DUF1985 domain-containing protein n=1 Tax=Brassica campestris TaxID=3711 RepID=M4EHB3_BRACM